LQQQKKIHLIDTNVILRYFIGDDEEKALKATALMERLEDGEEVAEVKEVVLAESVWTLEKFYQVPREEIKEKLFTVLNFKGVTCQDKESYLQALVFYGSSKADFADCLLAADSLRRKVTIYSFDEKDFRKLGASWKLPSAPTTDSS